MVDGATLSRHRRGCVGECQSIGDVVSWQHHPAAVGVGDSDRTVGADLFEDPAVPVLDRDAAIGDEAAVVTTGLHLVADECGRPVGQRARVNRSDDLAGVEAQPLRGVVQLGGRLVGGGEHHDVAAFLAQLGLVAARLASLLNVPPPW